VPVAVNLSPHFSSTDEIALQLDEAGADALVLFNRFLASTRRRSPWCIPLLFSRAVDALLPRTWIALLRGMRSALAAAMEGSKTPPTVTATHHFCASAPAASLP
jgi:dihydroorotate dehydrogenase (fumarate)